MARLRPHLVAWLTAPWMRPVSPLLARWYGGLATSLLYHRAAAGPADSSSPRGTGFRPNLCLSVAEDRFDAQMRELRMHYRATSLPQAVRELTQQTLTPGTVTVTFDDGYRDNLRVALPILERHGIPATVYIVTGLIDRTALLWWEELETIVSMVGHLTFEWKGRRCDFDLNDLRAQRAAYAAIVGIFRGESHASQHVLAERLRDASGARFDLDREILSWDEVRELDRHPLITIAAHTVSHPVLSHIGRDEVIAEMHQSRQRLEQMLGHPVSNFAYPFGGSAEAGRREFELCAAEGFDFAVTTRTGHWHAGHRQHLHSLPRIMVDYFDTLEDFRFKLSGLHAFLRQKGRRFVTT